MMFLPVVGRELRVSARKRSTFWSRVVAAIVALVIGAGFMILSAAFGGGTAQLGSTLFGLLTWLALAAVLSAGLFFTADSLSEEKREGTLGFLFLTDLRGYDVAGGKLLATSLRGSYALLAFFPVLAITLLMGGVTGAQFWKTTLALVNVLFLSLAMGLFVSSISRDPQKAMAGTFLLLLVASAAGPLADWLLSLARAGRFKPLLSLTSPVYLFSNAGAWGRAPYWSALVVNHVCAWVLLGLASLLVPRTWQERARRPTTRERSRAFSWKYGRAHTRLARRQKLLAKNPILWLAGRERWQALALWALALLMLALFCLAAWKLPPQFWVIWSQFGSLLVLTLYLWAASQAGRLVIETRRSGFLELLLVTPVGVEQIVRGQWRAFLEMFALPLALLLAVHLAGTSFAQQSTFGMMTTATGGTMLPDLLLVLFSALTMATVAANIIALNWFGMWMGMTSKNVGLAALKTIAFVQVIPLFVIGFISGLVAAAFMFSQATRGAFASGKPPTAVVITMPLVMGGVTALLGILKDLGFVLWARRRLYSAFRAQAVESIAPIRWTAPLVQQKPLISANTR